MAFNHSGLASPYTLSYSCPKLSMQSYNADGSVKSNVFFNSKVPIAELKKIGEDLSIDELFSVWGETQKKLNAWASNHSSPIKASPIKSQQTPIKFPFGLTPPPGFEKVKPINSLSDISTESEVSPAVSKRNLCTVFSNDIKLQPAPNKNGLIKREKRGTFVQETVSGDRLYGEIKFYQLKKRFGFLALDADGSDVFICEDDLILSGVNMKKFKEAVFQKCRIRLSFQLKNYLEKDKIKRKAIEIQLVQIITN